MDEAIACASFLPSLVYSDVLQETLELALAKVFKFAFFRKWCCLLSYQADESLDQVTWFFFFF